ncbi:NADH-quinone oxidoreductase subunit C [Candidatus Azambacteria bacterium]|nr:NADH-quinone oxidoreductase subunit C [Candidatus Azambacteria bacterium]
MPTLQATIQAIHKEFPAFSLDEKGKVSTMRISAETLKPIVALLIGKHWRLLTMAGNDERAQAGVFTVSWVFGLAKENKIMRLVLPVDPRKPVFPSIFELVQSALLFELEIRDMFGLTPEGNPDLSMPDEHREKMIRRLVHHHNWPEGEYPLRKDFPWNKRPKEEHVTFPFRYSEGEGVFEIPVGPIHAGVIEPGHFRFTAVGEMILNLEIRLYYSHRGVEKLFEQKSIPDAVALAEHISGDTSFGHSLAFCEALEELSGISISRRAGFLRVIFLELERLYNHVGDIGMLGMDAGFAFGGAQGARLKEVCMQMNERLTGSRILRGINVVGGVTRDISEKDSEMLGAFLDAFASDFQEVTDIMLSSSSFLDRLETTGKLKTQTALDYNVVGPVARASGLRRDARKDFPNAWWKEFQFQISVQATGDVYARFMVRTEEVLQSIKIIKTALLRLPKGERVMATQPIRLTEGACVVSIVEGWRGELVHVVVAGKNNSLYRVKVRDASFLNWPTLSRAILNNIVPDFPLCNKSYNMSYAGNDL